MSRSWSELVAARAAAAPGVVAVAVDGGHGDLTFGEWDRRSNALARGLAARGVREGDRVALLFDMPRWPDFAVAHLGVLRAGGVAVLLPAGAAPPDVARAVAHAAAVWLGEPADVARGHDDAPFGGPARPDALAELVYPPAPLARPRPWARTHGELARGPGVDVGAGLVHCWAPGSRAGQHALRFALDGAQVVATAFDPDRVGVLTGAACGLTPALAAALLASGAPSRHDLSSVTRVLLSAPPSARLRAGLAVAFPRASVEVVGEAPVPGPSGAAPVAVSQEGMLWHEQFSPGSFNLPCLVRRYQGHLDVPALEWALSELVRRHEPLRTTFEVVGGRPVQVVEAHRPLKLDAIGATADQVAELVTDASHRPFDVVTGPLFEPRLLRLGPDDHVLVVRLHHTVFDDWSVDVFRREVSALYTARLAGRPSPLMEPVTTFSEASRRRQARLAGEAGAAQRAWWRQELDGAPLAVQLPIGAGGPDGGAAPLQLDLPRPLVEALRALAPRLRATPFMTVLAAFSVLLSRVTGQDDLLVATVTAHRDRSDLEPLVGCFTKKVPLRLRTGGDVAFPDLVARTRASLLGALAHQDVAFDAVVQDALGPAAAEHGVVPHVAVVVQGETPRRVPLSLPGLATGPFDVAAEARGERHFSARPDRGPAWGGGVYLHTFLILSVVEDGDDLALVARGVFATAEAIRLLEALRALLEEVAADPYRLLSQLGPPPSASLGDDVVDVRGFRAPRRRLEAAMARVPGVAEVALAVEDGRLVASVVPATGGPPPTLADLRRGVWADLPGGLWPAAAVVAGSGPAAAGPEGPRAVQLAAMWEELSGRAADPHRSYWQDFSFLQVLAEARAAGMAVGDAHVVRSRTPAILAAAMNAG